jgi:hypothetical protein
MNWRGCGRKRSCPNFKYYTGICLEGLTKTMKNLSQDSRSPGRDSNPGPPEYYAGMLTTRPRRSVIVLHVADHFSTSLIHNECSSATCPNSVTRLNETLESQEIITENNANFNYRTCAVSSCLFFFAVFKNVETVILIG